MRWPGVGYAADIDVQLRAPASVGVQPRKRRFADHGAGGVEIIAVFVGAAADHRVVIGNGIGLAHRDMFAKAWTARQLIGRAGEGGPRSELLVKPHRLGGARHCGWIDRWRLEIRLGQRHHAVVGPGRNAEAPAVVEKIAGEIDVRLTGVETGIEMRIADRNERRRVHDPCRLHHQPHGEGHRLAFAAVEPAAIAFFKLKCHGATFSRARRLSVT